MTPADRQKRHADLARRCRSAFVTASLDAADAAELAETLQLIACWLAADPGTVTPSLPAHDRPPRLRPGRLRGDLDHFAFLLGGSWRPCGRSGWVRRRSLTLRTGSWLHGEHGRPACTRRTSRSAGSRCATGCCRATSTRPYRRHIKGIRNLQEGRHDLARKICHGKKGELYHRYERGLENRLGALGLVLTRKPTMTTDSLAGTTPRF